MNAAVVRSTYKKTDLDQAVKEYKETVLPAIAGHPGARSAMFLLNRDTGEAISVAIYEDQASAAAFAPKAQKLIESFMKYNAGGAKPERAVFEIATSTQLESRQVVEHTFKAINAHDLEAAARDSAPDAELTAPGDMKVKGPQAIKEFNKNWITAFPDARLETKNIFTQGNQVVVEAIFAGTHEGTLKTPMGDIPATGRKVRGDFVEVFEVDRGLIKKARLMFDQVQLMTQLGMAPAPPQQAAQTRR